MLISNDSGCPDSIRAMSGSGPFGPIFSGVWQSLQPPMVTRYLPRSTRLVWLAAFRPGAGGCPERRDQGASGKTEWKCSVSWLFPPINPNKSA